MKCHDTFVANHIDGSVQNCSNSIANALELLHLCTKPSISGHYIYSKTKSIYDIIYQFDISFISVTEAKIVSLSNQLNMLTIQWV